MLRSRVGNGWVLGVVVSWVVCTAGSMSAADWPRFRGPNGSGISDDKHIPVEFKAESALWTRDLPGRGHSSPVVLDGRIYLTTATKNSAERLLICITLADGKIVWQTKAPGGVGQTHKKNSLASGTVQATKERLYVPFFNGENVHLSAYSLEGTPIWDRDLGGFTSQHGPGLSPIAVGNRVIYLNEQDGQASLIGLDAETGKTVWETPRTAARANYATPILHERNDGQQEVLVAASTGVVGYNPITGHENWAWRWNGNPLRAVASPVLGQGLVFLSTGNGGNDRNAVAVRTDGSGTVPDGFVAWESKKGFPYVPSMLVWGDYLYFVSDKGFAACHSAKTGEQIWSERLGGGFTASPILVDGKIYAINEDGEVFVYPAEPSFKLLATNSLQDSVLASPAVADGKLLIRGSEKLYCFGK